jgi:hypothetical protein
MYCCGWRCRHLQPISSVEPHPSSSRWWTVSEVVVESRNKKRLDKKEKNYLQPLVVEGRREDEVRMTDSSEINIDHVTC